MNYFFALSLVQYSGIVLAGFLLTALVLFLLLREQKSVKAVDGTIFSSEEARRAYESVFKRVDNLYSENDKNSGKVTLGFKSEFLKLLQNDGFADVKTLLIYREDFKKLVELFQEESI